MITRPTYAGKTTLLAIFGYGSLLFLVAAPVAFFAAPPVAITVTILALLAVGATCILIVLQNVTNAKRILLVAFAMALSLDLLCPEYNGSASTLLGGLVLSFPLTYLVSRHLIFAKWIRH